MKKDTYERLSLVVTEFDAEDVIVTSGEIPGPGQDDPAFQGGGYEVPISF